MIKQYQQTFDPSLKYEDVENNLYHYCELIMNNIPVMADVFLLDSIDTPYKTWNPYSRFNGKMVDAFNERTTRELNYNDIRDWSMDDKHGIVHSIFVAFWGFYVLNKRKGRSMIEMFHTEDDCFVDTFYASLVHDFYRTFKSQGHAQKLKEYFPNAIEEVYRHTKPADGDEKCPFVIGDRIELMRYGVDVPDYEVFKDDISPEEFTIIKFFYENFRSKFDYVWQNRHEPVATHFVENWHDWDFSSKIYPSVLERGMPENTCSVFVRPNFYTLEEINNRYFMYGVIPLKDFESLPLKFRNEHPVVKHDMMNDIDDWVLIYTQRNAFQLEAVKNKIYPIRHDILMEFVNFTDQIYSNFIINSYYEK